MVLHELFEYSPIELLIAVGAVLALLEWGYIVFARRLAIGPPVEDRSSHSVFTPTGGGILWALTAIAATIAFGNLADTGTWIFIGGIITLGAISYADDLHPLPPVPRLIGQIIVMALSFKALCTPGTFDIYLLVLFCGVGLINAVNFLDGICGMIGLYGIVVSATLVYALHIYHTPETVDFIPILLFTLVAQIVFTAFNLRDVIFSGDVGAITLGYIQVFIALSLALSADDGSMMIFFAVCVFDTGLTTAQRLFAGISILKPHRMNIYQILTTERGLPHLVVALVYALLQLLINALFFLVPAEQHWTYFLVVCSLLTLAYFGIRFAKQPK